MQLSSWGRSLLIVVVVVVHLLLSRRLPLCLMAPFDFRAGRNLPRCLSLYQKLIS